METSLAYQATRIPGPLATYVFLIPHSICHAYLNCPLLCLPVIRIYLTPTRVQKRLQNIISWAGQTAPKVDLPRMHFHSPRHSIINKGEFGLPETLLQPSGASQVLVQFAPLPFVAGFICNLQRGKRLSCTLRGMYATSLIVISNKNTSVVTLNNNSYTPFILTCSSELLREEESWFKWIIRIKYWWKLWVVLYCMCIDCTVLYKISDYLIHFYVHCISQKSLAFNLYFNNIHWCYGLHISRCWLRELVSSPI